MRPVSRNLDRISLAGYAVLGGGYRFLGRAALHHHDFGTPVRPGLQRRRRERHATERGSYPITIAAVDAVGASASRSVTLTIDPAPGNYTISDEGKGKITAIGPGYLMVGSKKLIWNAATRITVNEPAGEVHMIDSFVQVGMKVQWKGLRDKSTNTVLTSQLEVN